MVANIYKHARIGCFHRQRNVTVETPVQMRECVMLLGMECVCACTARYMSASIEYIACAYEYDMCAMYITYVACVSASVRPSVCVCVVVCL